MEDFNIDKNYLKKLSEKYKNKEHPLFMSELPNNIEENEDLDALYNLMIDDENPISLSINYKNVGNEYFNEGIKYYNDAIISYNKGIAILKKYSENIKKKDQKKYLQEEKKINEILSDIHCNKAIIFYKQKKFVECLNECKHSLKYNKKAKSYYYCILCSYNLQLFKESYKYIEIFEEITENHEINNLLDIQKYTMLKNDVIKKYKQIINKQQLDNIENKKIIEKEEIKKNEIIQILKNRNITIVNNIIVLPSNINPLLYKDENLYIHFTLSIHFFENNIIETIIDFPENATILDAFEKMNKNYDINSLYCYLEYENELFYYFHYFHYFCDIINKIKLFSPIMHAHVIENDEINNFFKNKNKIIYL